jgi:hypothetical protein
MEMVKRGQKTFKAASLELGKLPSGEAGLPALSGRRRRGVEPRQPGELVQFDGSHHDWFEGRRGRCCLITLIDDATKTRLSQFFEEETMFGAMTVLKRWIETCGIPESLYCDKKNAFVLTRDPTDKELLAGITLPKSRFGKACDRLGIDAIASDSPQTKGRVERNHGVDQDRLVQILPETKPKPKLRPGDAVLVRVRLDASVRLFWKNKTLPAKEIKTIFDD